MSAMTQEEAVDQLAYYGEDAAMAALIVATLLRLPRTVAAFATDRCRFVSVGRATWGMTLPSQVATDAVSGRTCAMWLILLEESLPAADAPGIIAHEIAHAWLKHDRTSPDLPDDCEVQTTQLVRSWGFSGRGADVELEQAALANWPTSGRSA